MKEHDRTVLDATATLIAAGSLLQWLPPLAAAISVVWLFTRLFEYVRWVRRGRDPEEKPW